MMASRCKRFVPISIERKTSTDDGYGGRVNVWTELARTRATIEPLSGREQLMAMRLRNPITHRFRFRYRSGLTGADRIAFRGRTFNIRSVIDEREMNRWLIVVAAEDVQATA